MEYLKQANRFCVSLVAKCNWLQSAKAHANRWMEVDNGNHHDQDTVVNNLPGEHSSGLWKNEGQVGLSRVRLVCGGGGGAGRGNGGGGGCGWLLIPDSHPSTT